MVVGPDIADTVGSLMDQDGDGATGESVDDRYTSNFTVYPPLIYYANMDTDPGWTFGANNPATNGWAYGQPTGQGANPYRNNDPNSGFTGPNVVGYNLNGDYQTSIPDTRWVTTPAFDCSGHKNVTLSFKRWLGVSSGDYAYIQVSNNGSSWTTVWQNPAVPTLTTMHGFPLIMIFQRWPTEKPPSMSAGVLAKPSRTSMVVPAAGTSTMSSSTEPCRTIWQ